MRGNDGYLLPYSAGDTRQYAYEAAVAATRVGTLRHVSPLLSGYTLRLYDVPEGEYSYAGPGLYWTVWAGEELAGAGHFERDLEWEAEDGQQLWTEQGAFVLPAYQRKGIYSAVLRAVPRLTGMGLAPDSQQTLANAQCWAKRESELPR